MATRKRQQEFPFIEECTTEHGGSHAIGKRKSIRPLAATRATHLILKSSEDNPINKGKRCSFFNPTNLMLKKIVFEHAIKYGIKVYFEPVMNHSHAHIVIKVPSRRAYNAFIRTLNARLVRFFSKIAKRSLAGLFDLIPYTRVLNKGENPLHLRDYLDKNAQEAMGMGQRRKKEKTSSQKESERRSQRAKAAEDPSNGRAEEARSSPRRR